MWTDYYFRFADEAAFVALLPEGWLEQPFGPDYAVDVVGEGAGGGWLVNLRLREGAPLPDGWAAAAIAAPVYPLRVFA